MAERIIAPYQYPNNVPDFIKNLPAGAQKIFVKTFNAVYRDTKDEDQARKAGWAQVKRQYYKKGGKWVRRTAATESIELEVSSINRYDREGGDVEYSITLHDGEEDNRIYLSFNTTPPEFLSTIGNKIVVTLSDTGGEQQKVDRIEAFYPGNFFTHRLTAAATDEEKNAQKARSKRYGISILENGHVTKPSAYSDCPDGKFADPVNYNYPMNNATRAVAAVRYFGMPRNYGQYSQTDRAKVWGRIKRLAKPHVEDLDPTPPWKREK